MRETGYYWVKVDAFWRVAKWIECGYFSRWEITGLERGFNDSDMDQINETRIKDPDER